MKTKIYHWFQASFGLAVIVSSITQLSAQITIDLPDALPVLPNTPGQTFNVFVQNSTGSDRTDITGLFFTIQTADGGAPAGGSISAPAITGADIIASGTLFNPNNNGTTGGSVVPQVFSNATLTQSGTVTIPNGQSTKLAVVTVDTTGFFSGTYTMTLNTHDGATAFSINNGSGQFGPADGLVLLDGSLSIVPEPNAAMVVAGLLLGVAGVWRWRKTPRSDLNLP